MSSWLADLANKAEDLLNKVDQSAAQALHTEDEQNSKGNHSAYGWQQSSDSQVNELPGSGGFSPYLGQQQQQQQQQAGLDKSGSQSSITSSSSVPSNLNKLENGKGTSAYNSQMSRSMYSTSQASLSGKQSPATTLNNKKDKDEELFEFLNSPDSVETKRSKSPLTKLANNGRHSRQSSTSSTISNKSGKTPDAISQSSSTGLNMSASVDKNEDMDSVDHSPVAIDMHEDQLGNADSSSGYHSNHEDNISQQQQHLSSLELENRLLKNEVASLNQEMTSVIQRAKSSQEELQRVRHQFEQQSRQLTKSEQISRELQAQESDMQEAMNAKDSQLAVLRVRFEEAEKEIASERRVTERLQMDNHRILQDHTSVSGVQSQAMESLKDKLNDAEFSLRREKESFQKSQNDALDRHGKLEEEQRSLSEALAAAQKKLSEEKAKKTEISNQLKSNKALVTSAKQELAEYKEKATRILQSKDKLITSLKEGTAGSGELASVSQAELEEVRQEKDMFREEVQKCQMTMETLRAEIGDLEVQMQQDSDAAHEQVSSLEEQLAGEKRRREDAELEVNKQKQELRFAHEELLKQKTALQNRVQDREQEIERLRNQLTTKSVSTSSQAELENRLHALTESLIQKQTMLEALSTEKNSLVLQLERTEKHYREAEAMAVRASSTSVPMNEEEEGTMRQRLPTFMKESPLDGDISRRVKRAANSIDKFSIRLGVFLRRYPIARVFVIVYMFLLHLWVMIVLLTYQPEMHGLDYSPHEPH